jgi:hypothetical protein
VSTATKDPRTAPGRSPSGPAALEGFTYALRSEATKLRTVRGWLIGLAVAAVLLVALAALDASGSQIQCGGVPDPDRSTGSGGAGQASGSGGDCAPPKLPVGPGGEAVVDRSYLVHQTLSGNGSITARVASLVGIEPDSNPEPWAKAGLIVRAGTTPGASYAAVLATGAHGIRMQDDYTHDVAGSAGAVSASSPRWLRLTRSGDRVTGYESADGTHWTELGHADLSGLGTTATVGLFVASPAHEETRLQFGGVSSSGGPSLARAEFDDVGLAGGWSGSAWKGELVGDPVGGPGAAPGPDPGGYQESGGRFTVSGYGDIAPAVGGPTAGFERNLVGTFAALLAAIVVGAMFGTSEYRRRLARLTFAATPRRWQVLTAKAIVLAGATFLVGLVGTLGALWVGHLLEGDGSGVTVLPTTTWVEIRVVVGTAGMLALTAVLALAVGTMLRRSAAAVALAISLVVLPFMLAVAVILPVGAGEWLLRLTPAAAFAVQQTVPEYPQVLATYVPPLGYYPLPWWAGFGVMCAWTAGALALATLVVRRRDA